MEIEVFQTEHGQFIRVFNDYFPIILSDETDQHVHVWLPMENGAHLRFVVNACYARASLWVDALPANVKQGQIAPTSDAEAWRDDVQEASDLRMWLRQLGRIPLAGTTGDLANLEI